MDGQWPCTSKYFQRSSTKKQFTKKSNFAFLLPTNLGFSYNLEKSLSSSSSTTSTLMIMNIVSSSSSSPPSGQCQSVEDAPHQKLIRGDHQTKPETITAPLSFSIVSRWLHLLCEIRVNHRIEHKICAGRSCLDSRTYVLWGFKLKRITMNQ